MTLTRAQISSSKSEDVPLPGYAFEYGERVNQIYDRFVAAMDKAAEEWKADEANYKTDTSRVSDRQILSFPTLTTRIDQYGECLHLELSVCENKIGKRLSSTAGTHNQFKITLVNLHV